MQVSTVPSGLNPLVIAISRRRRSNPAPTLDRIAWLPLVIAFLAIGWKAGVARGIVSGMRSGLILVVAAIIASACSAPAPRACKPPRDYWKKPVLGLGLHVAWNVLTIDQNGFIFWNGSKIRDTQLGRLLEGSHSLDPEPQVYLEAEMGVTCDALEKVRNTMDETLQCRSGNGKCVEGYPKFVPMPAGG
ncbi:ExbD/TolR family protein [Sphingomonas crocodyli]|uniref:Uncharacterized protein n=1 Tax=Sphingomonas crocodyli TaxID=1979270 RepID=A0A437M526_9SPHN|nr:hypothetical protein [Sphingomonas crocodyli]RVT92673.1 hypothetical protein EOD43_01755 [Sphingomonas crocodyli]